MKRFVVLSAATLLPLPVLAGGPWTSAQWIWSAPDGPADTWMAFRRTVSVTSPPPTAVARIAADSKYWLWINGELVVFEGGLKRGPTPSDTWYDEVDIAPHLAAGDNTLAALVWYWGRNGFSHQDSGKGGLLFEVDLGGTTVASDSTWKCIVHPAHETTAVNPNYALPERNVRFDARNDSIAGWTEPAFDESSWSAAVPKGPAGAAPWNALFPRGIPQWKDSGLLDYENAGSFPPFGDGGVVQADLPYDAQVTPWLEVSAPAGLLIDIRTDQYLGGGPENVYAEYVTKDGVQSFEALGWMNGHAVLYTIPAGVQILSLRYRETGYDAPFAGSFQSSDPFCDSLWGKARRTLYVNLRDGFSDCPDRERAQYWGDVVNDLEQAFYALGPASHAIARKAILDLVRWQRADATLYSPVPSGNWSSELPQQMLAAVGWYGFWTYYLHTGDLATIRTAYPAVRDYLALWSLDADGLVAHRAGDWDWQDWGTNQDVRVLDNAWYALALRGAIEMATVTGNAQDVAAYQADLASLEANFDRVLWTGSGYLSPEHVGAVDDRANALAVVAGFGDESKRPVLLDVLRNQLSASPYLEKYVLQALFLLDAEDDALARMRERYAAMVDSSLTTLWEHWTVGPWTSTNHGWAGGPLTLLSRYAAGVAPETPGWATFHVLPQGGDLTTIDAVVPTAKGDVDVAIRRGPPYVLDVTSPSGTTATVGIPKKPFAEAGEAVTAVTVNGTLVWDGAFVGGVPGVREGIDDARFLRFEVDPGTWSFAASGEAVSSPAVAATPARLAFALPAPTPFRDRTVLRFVLPSDGPATLDVYDVAGRRVRRLVRGTLSSGAHAAPWDGRDEEGKPLPAGTYFVRLSADGRTVSRTVTRLR